jgi:hypothetical protein
MGTPAVIAMLLAFPLGGGGPPSGPAAPDSVPTLYRIDAGASDLFVVTHKSGLFSFLGHEHAVIPLEWSGEVCTGIPSRAGAHGSIGIRTGSLVIDSDSARSLAGLGEGPGEEDVREIQQTLLDPDHLAADDHPRIDVETRALESGDGGEIRVRTRVTLRDTTRSYEHPVTVEGRDDGSLRVTGSLTLRQRDFGIEPASVAGVVNVKDEVDLHFSLVALPTDRTCTIGEAPGS